MGQADRPENYDTALDRSTPDWKNGMPNPGLNATKDFGSATKDVLKTSSPVLGGQVRNMEGVRSNVKAKHGDMTHSSAMTGQGAMKGFKGAVSNPSQVPNTGPTPTTIHSKVSSRKLIDGAVSKVFHGNPGQKGL